MICWSPEYILFDYLMTKPRIPAAPKSIQKGVPLKNLLGADAIDCLARNLKLVEKQFDSKSFKRDAIDGLEPLGLMERGHKIAAALRQHLPKEYSKAIKVLLASLTPPREETEDMGLDVLFYVPHVVFVAEYGLDADGNKGKDPFDLSMQAQYELTRRFSAEFSIRPFLVQQQERTLSQLQEWISDPDPHVRRLCSEGTRPRLPWAKRIPAFIEDPSPALPILEALKDDPVLYVRRSVANHVADIAKDHADIAFELCERWLDGSSNELRWVIRHALRYPAKKGNKKALKLRTAAAKK